MQGDQHILKCLEIRPRRGAPYSHLRRQRPFISWDSESVQKGSFELRVGHASQKLHISSSGQRPTKDSSRRPGRVCWKCSEDSGLSFWGCPLWTELSLQPIGGPFSESSFGPGTQCTLQLSHFTFLDNPSDFQRKEQLGFHVKLSACDMLSRSMVQHFLSKQSTSFRS